MSADAARLRALIRALAQELATGRHELVVHQLKPNGKSICWPEDAAAEVGRILAEHTRLEESYIKLQAEWLATTKELGEARVAVEFARREALEEAAKVARDFAKAPARNLLRRGMGLSVWAASKPLALQAIRTCAAIRALAQKEG